jgi:DNA-binding transcriptional LysR family regulator
MINANHLQAFHAVAHTLSFTRAAALLHITQPAVTIGVKALEESVGHKLLFRSPRYVALTDSGALVLAHADRVLQMEHDLLAALRGDAGGVKGGHGRAGMIGASLSPEAIAAILHHAVDRLMA